MTLAAGKLRHRILIEQYIALQDSNGEALQDPLTGEVMMDWTSLAEVWAAIEPLSAREFIAAQATQSKISARITIRHREDLDASMRLIHMRSGGVRGKVYNPAGFLADPMSGLEYLTIPCSEGVSTTGQ